LTTGVGRWHFRKTGKNCPPPEGTYSGESEMRRHIHADQMAAYAADAMQTDEPYQRWEASAPYGSWYDLKSHPAWADDHRYRRKTDIQIMVGMLELAWEQLDELQRDSPLSLDHPMWLILETIRTLKMRGDTQ